MEKALGVEVNSNKENLVRVMNNVFEIPEIKAYREGNKYKFIGGPWNGEAACWIV